MNAPRPRPAVTDDNAPFWSAIRDHELSLPCCNECRKTYLPPAPVCPFCLSLDVGWRKASGKGVLNAWTRVHRPFLKSFADDVPYIVAQVELEEGPRIITNLVGLQPDEEPRIGMKVQAIFQAVDELLELVQFKPIQPVADASDGG